MFFHNITHPDICPKCGLRTLYTTNRTNPDGSYKTYCAACSKATAKIGTVKIDTRTADGPITQTGIDRILAAVRDDLVAVGFTRIRFSKFESVFQDSRCTVYGRHALPAINVLVMRMNRPIYEYMFAVGTVTRHNCSHPVSQHMSTRLTQTYPDAHRENVVYRTDMYEREVRYRKRQDMRIAAKEVRRFYTTVQNNFKFAESQRQRFRDRYGEDIPIDRMITIQIPVMPDDMYQR